MKERSARTFYHSIEEMISACFGAGVHLLKMECVPGGDINQAYRVTLSSGNSIFVKTNAIHNVHFFLAEANGLEAFRSAEKIGVPKILGVGTDKKREVSFLAMEYIKSSQKTGNYWETFGYELANLHRACSSSFVTLREPGGKFGFAEDNYIGASPQKNDPKEKWVDFYRECRLLPQLTMAERYLPSAIRKKAQRLLEHLEDYMREPEFPSLLHGDLWSGNILCGDNEKAWIIDPAVYVGDCETDLAMLQLFGRIPESFWEGYRGIIPIDLKEYGERRPLYDLYHLLNHLNLFGYGYLGEVVDIIKHYG